MKDYLLSDRFYDLAILITSEMKPEYYIRRKIFHFFDFWTRLFGEWKYMMRDKMLIIILSTY